MCFTMCYYENHKEKAQHENSTQDILKHKENSDNDQDSLDKEFAYCYQFYKNF